MAGDLDLGSLTFSIKIDLEPFRAAMSSAKAAATGLQTALNAAEATGAAAGASMAGAGTAAAGMGAAMGAAAAASAAAATAMGGVSTSATAMGAAAGSAGATILQLAQMMFAMAGAAAFAAASSQAASAGMTLLGATAGSSTGGVLLLGSGTQAAGQQASMAATMFSRLRAMLASMGGTIQSAAAQLRSLAVSAQQAAPQVSGLGNSIKMLAGGLVAFAAIKVGQSMLTMAGDMEQSRIAFKTLLGDAQKAEQFLDDLSRFAANTPFNLKGLQQSSRQLLAYGFQMEQIIPMMTDIGDAAAASGMGQEAVDRMVRALGQMRAKGKVTMEELNQIGELGLPVLPMLAQAAGKTVGEMQKLIEQGVIKADSAITAILGGLGSSYGGTMKEQADTFLGAWGNAVDGIQQAMTQLGLAILDAIPLKDWLKSVGESLSLFANLVDKVGIREAFNAMVPEGVKIALFAVAGAIAVVGASILYGMIPSLIAMAAAAWSAMAPFLPLIAIGVALGALAYLLYKTWKPTSAFFQNLWKVIAASFKWGWQICVVALRELQLGVAKFLDFTVGNLLRFSKWVSKAFEWIRHIPGLGALYEAMQSAGNAALDMVEGFVDSSEQALDEAKHNLTQTAGEISAAWDEMKESGREMGAAMADTVKGLFKGTDRDKLKELAGMNDATADSAKTAANETRQLGIEIDKTADKAAKAKREGDKLFFNRSLRSLWDAWGSAVAMNNAAMARATMANITMAGGRNMIASQVDSRQVVVQRVEQVVSVNGRVRHEGVNGKGQLVASMDQLAQHLRVGQDRYPATRTPLQKYE